MKNNFKFIDLFCGLGGFRIALEKQNCNCVFSSDIDKAVAQVYENNFGGLLGEIVKEAVDEFTWAYNFSVGGKHKDLNKIVREMKWISNDINFLDEWQIAK